MRECADEYMDNVLRRVFAHWKQILQIQIQSTHEKASSSLVRLATSTTTCDDSKSTNRTMVLVVTVFVILNSQQNGSKDSQLLIGGRCP
jgi:hypothetical protein